jgi:hypothetical protein
MSQLNVEEIKERARALLLRMMDHAASSADELRPDPADYAAVFERSAVERARVGFEMLWLRSPRPHASAGQTELALFAAPASLLTDENEISRNFPGGYRRIAHLLVPHRIWLAWKYAEPGGTTVAYDGLVWLDGRFAWFPKPWRVIGD